MNIKKNKYTNTFSVQAQGNATMYNKISGNVSSFVQINQNANRQLFMFRNVLSNKLQSKIQKVTQMTEQQMASAYIPFVFNIYTIPMQMVIALAAANIGLGKDQLQSLQKINAQTLYFEAKNAIRNSIVLGRSTTLDAQNIVKDSTTTLKNMATTTFKAIQTGFNTAKNVVNRVYQSLWGLTRSKKDNLEKQFAQQILNKQKSFTDTGGISLMQQYIKGIRSYGSVLLDFYFLKNFALQTNAFGKTVMYLPQIESLLFRLEGGQPYVYYKSPNRIQIIPQSQFTIDFLSGVVKGLVARENADIISTYNNAVSEKQDKPTRRQNFKQKLGDSYWSTVIAQNIADRGLSLKDLRAKMKEINQKAAEQQAKILAASKT